MAETNIHKYTVAEKLNKMEVDLITDIPDIAEATLSLIHISEPTRPY